MLIMSMMTQPFCHGVQALNLHKLPLVVLASDSGRCQCAVCMTVLRCQTWPNSCGHGVAHVRGRRQGLQTPARPSCACESLLILKALIGAQSAGTHPCHSGLYNGSDAGLWAERALRS